MDIPGITSLIVTAIASLIALFLLTKLMGNKQMSELSMFDYICGITIGSIAAEMATELEEVWKPLLAMTIYALVALLISYATNKSIKIRRILSGRALVLLDHGKLYKENLNKAHIDINELLMIARNNGYFDISQVETAIFEPNGKISFMPKSKYRPMIPDDMKLTPKEDRPVANVIIDGHIMFKNLQYTGNNEKWLMKQLHTFGISDVRDVSLATCTTDNQVSVYKKIEKLDKKDILE